jgi:leader peptidase (prepilin peptidase)/N-methyltransferase
MNWPPPVDVPTVLLFSTVYAFVWGAIWGSFYNVVVWRFPRGMSLSKPPSHCPVCSTPIHWYDNVPILAWLWLRGRCRACGTAISPRYPGVETLVAVLSALLWYNIAHESLGVVPIELLAVRWLLGFAFFSLLVCIAFIDIDLQIIPHALSFPAMALGLLIAFLHQGPLAEVATFPAPSLLESFSGLVVGGGFIVLLFLAYKWWTGFEGVGLGDATLLAAIGANYGLMSLIVVLMFASFQGLAAALLIAAVDRVRGQKAGDQSSALLRGAHREEFWDPETGLPRHAVDNTAPAEAEIPDEGFLKLGLPFGPFLALAAVEYAFFGHLFLSWLTAGMYP